ncbi:MAG: HisA/HisF-related TIM barrel protein, partial [Pyrinomonadaceae bacterium]
MIEIIPAMDLIGGKCVRLVQGDFSRETVYSTDPLETAKRFEDAGLKRLHIVDLDGARAGTPANLHILK